MARVDDGQLIDTSGCAAHARSIVERDIGLLDKSDLVNVWLWYGRLQQHSRLLWLWEAAARRPQQCKLLVDCPFPNVAALLVHRLKDEHFAEDQQAAAATVVSGTTKQARGAASNADSGATAGSSASPTCDSVAGESDDSRGAIASGRSEACRNCC